MLIAVCEGQEVGVLISDNTKQGTMDGERQRRALCENDEIENSDESSESRPSGERWAPVGANDGDNEFADEYKYVNANVERYVCGPVSSPSSPLGSSSF